jgi:hopene-associated glycosyltransferase HpnB
MTALSDSLLALTVLTLVTWLVLFFLRGAFWQIRRYDADRDFPPPPSTWPPVVAIIPARNEALTVGQVIQSLARQNYPGEFRVIVVDDDSHDGTVEAARRAAVEAGIDSRLEVIPAPALPNGWTGKVWAMNAGVRAASRHAPEWYWFVDADVVAAPDALRFLVSRATRDDLSLASLMVLLEAKNFSERLLIPPFLYFFLMLYPPRWLADPKSRTAGAAGGFLLLRRDALERIGGFAAIADEVIDDCSLGRAVKRSGGRIWMGLTRMSRSIRRYETFARICDMIARTAFTQLHYSVAELLETLFGILFTFVLPVLMTFSPDPRIWPCALAVWTLMSVSLLPTLIFYSVSPLFAPLLPFAAIFYAYATSLSAVRYWHGHGAQWKERSQAPAR